MTRMPSRLARLLAATSALALILAAPSQAQAATAAPASDDGTGKRIDHSRVRDLPPGPSTEREAGDFAPLSPSALTRQITVMMPPPAPAALAPTEIHTAVVEDRLDGATFESGRAELLPQAREMLSALAERLRGKPGLRFEIVGYTDNQRLSANLRKTYPDNPALSEARARAVAAFLAERLGLPAAQFTASGMGESQPIASNATPEGMAANRRTVIRAAYEDVVVVPPPAQAPPQPVATLITRDACEPPKPTQALPFSISVDGHPIDADSRQVEADRQRCVDVALERADIQIKYDPLNVAPALNVWALPAAVGRVRAITWRTYSNYAWWLKKAEIRVFVRGQSVSERPVAIVPVTVGGEATWTPPAESSQDLGYVLRVYDANGRFDETAVKTISLFDIPDHDADAERAERDARSGYGQSSLKVHNIAAYGGAVTISGDRVKPGETVAALGAPVPVDEHGHFVTRQILPSGPHQVDVAVTGADGRTARFQRNLSIADKDWFYVAVADLTAAAGRTTGPAPIVTGDTTHYDKQTSVDGRAAFYLKGKIFGNYLLTASADTQEQPFKDLFSNFASKDPNYLLRRIDPNRYYPVYGDDSTVVADAPTQGKFYVRLERDASFVMWGNFQTSWSGTELTQYSRGLYGGDLVWKSPGTTASGERRTTLNAFAAEPGTLQSREEFRGTGGSLYYFHRQDLTEGSERLWVEVRDKDSGIALQRTLLAPSQDYQVDYLQGRLTLRAPLPVVADSGSLIDATGLSGNPVYLVATYEYVPGLTALHGSTVGVRASHWLTDWLRVGGSYYDQGDGGIDQKLGGVDATLRYGPGTWLSGEAARSKGVGVQQLSSLSGGFDFTQNTSANVSANAFRLDGAVDLSDLSAVLHGRLTAYWQQRDRGFTGPGLITPNGEGMHQAGFAAVVPVTVRAEIALKVDDRHLDSQTQSSAETAVRVKLSPQWGVSVGVRVDDRKTGPALVGAVASASPNLIRNGQRADAVVRLDFRPLEAGQADASADAPIEHIARSPIYSAAPGASSVTADAGGPAGSLLSNAIGRTPGTVAPISDPTAAAGVAAARIEGLRYKDWNAYGFVQDTLSRSGNRPRNDRAGVGASWQVSRKVRLGGEVSGGDGGAGGKISADYSPDDRSTLYLSYARETEVPDQNYAGRQGLLTVGGRMKLNDQLGVFAESREASGEGPHSLTNGFGVDFAPARNWTSGVRLDVGRLSDPLAGDLTRRAISLNLGYRNLRLKASGALEYRDDRSTSLGSVAGTCSTGDLTPTNTPCLSTAGSDKRQTLLLKSALSYQADPAWRMLGSLNLSRSTSSQGAFYDGDYTEVILGAAYRPVDNDRWNTLFKYTYFYNLPSSGQVGGASNAILDYTQRSHVLNIDTIYDLRPWLSIGAKLGVRVGELKASRIAGPWVSSQAELGVLRADLHFVKEWDGLLEFRALKVNSARDLRSGALVGLYRHVGEHAKIGAGYNFTDYSDDLTDQSYRSRGVFINAITTF